MAIFDKEANGYDEWYKTKLGAFSDKVQTELALSIFKPKPGMKILDVGCGTGNFSIKLAEMGCKVIGIDKSEKMLEKAKIKVKDKGLDIEFHVMDVYDLNFCDESFDGVFSMAAFEFIYEPQKAYNEMYRVLEKDGQMLIGTINKKSSWGEFYLSEIFQKDSVFKYADFKSMDDLKLWNAKEILDNGECLFISPDTEDKDISKKLEKELSLRERGGFICALWKKGK